MRIGGSDGEWTPAHSNYREYREYAWGSGWKVWVGLSGNPAVQQALPRGELPVQQYLETMEITVDDNLID